MAITYGDVTAIPGNLGPDNGDGFTVVSADAPEGALVIGGGFVETQANGDDAATPTGAHYETGRPKSDGTGWEVLAANSASAGVHGQAFVIYLD